MRTLKFWCHTWKDRHIWTHRHTDTHNTEERRLRNHTCNAVWCDFKDLFQINKKKIFDPTEKWEKIWLSLGVNYWNMKHEKCSTSLTINDMQAQTKTTLFSLTRLAKIPLFIITMMRGAWGRKHLHTCSREWIIIFGNNGLAISFQIKNVYSHLAINRNYPLHVYAKFIKITCKGVYCSLVLNRNNRRERQTTHK